MFNRELTKEQLLSKVSRNSTVVAELRSSNAWNLIKQDLEERKVEIDNAWAYIPDSDIEKLRELRISKLAILHILSLQENYEHDLLKAQELLSQADDPELLNKTNYGVTSGAVK